MNWDIVEGNWKQFRGYVKEQWGKLTERDLERIEGKRDKLLGRLQEKYGLSMDEANARINEFESDYDFLDNAAEMPARSNHVSPRL